MKHDKRDKNPELERDKRGEIINSALASTLNYGIFSNGIVTKGDFPVPTLGEEYTDREEM